MSNTLTFTVITIIVGFIFAIVVELICINNEIKRLNYLVENLNDSQHHNEIRDDYIFEKVSNLMREIKKIKGQIFTIDEEGEK